MHYTLTKVSGVSLNLKNPHHKIKNPFNKLSPVLANNYKSPINHCQCQHHTETEIAIETYREMPTAASSQTLVAALYLALVLMLPSLD